MATKEEKERAEELGNSRILDVHKWSDYSEVNKAIDAIFKEFQALPEFKGKQNLQKKHIKVIVLDLYVRYLEDIEGYISYYRMKGKYKGKSRYNKLHISFTSVTVIDNLEKLGYLEQVKGHYDRTGKRPSHMSRMRATEKLIDLVEKKHNISLEKIEKAPNTECIILRDKDAEGKKVDTPYNDDQNTNALRKDLYAYNNLLRRSHIDVHSYPEEGAYSRAGDKLITLDRANKFVRRIYNNGSWDDGGRYYGGWWQRIPKDWRKHIRIDGSPTIEIDYSGLHIILLYGLEGIDYWNKVGVDPYQIEGYENSDEMRNLLKMVLLITLNAKSRGAAIKAVRSKINKNKDKYQWVLNERVNIEELINKFSETHKPISKYFSSGHGIKLQNIDSRIAERVINQLTEDETPVLCIHDSFIISKEDKGKIHQLMIESFNKETSNTRPKMTDNIDLFIGEGVVPWKGHIDCLIEEEDKDRESKELQRRLRKHQSIKWTKEYYKIDTK